MYNFIDFKKSQNLVRVLSEIAKYNSFQIISTDLYFNMQKLNLPDIFIFYSQNSNFIVSTHQLIIIFFIGFILLYSIQMIIQKIKKYKNTFIYNSYINHWP